MKLFETVIYGLQSRETWGKSLPPEITRKSGCAPKSLKIVYITERSITMCFYRTRSFAPWRIIFIRLSRGA